MTKGEIDFKRQHEHFCWLRSQSIWDGGKMRKAYPFNELACHVMLSGELFYLWNEDAVKRALMYINDAYPGTTEDDLKKVRDMFSDMVSKIYG